MKQLLILIPISIKSKQTLCCPLSIKPFHTKQTCGGGEKSAHLSPAARQLILFVLGKVGRGNDDDDQRCMPLWGY
jgi:hypothetical protein